MSATSYTARLAQYKPLVSAQTGTAVDLGSDTNLAPPCRAIYVGTSGDVKVVLAEDTVAVTFKNVPVGFLAVSAKTISSTANGTTAADLVAVK